MEEWLLHQLGPPSLKSFTGEFSGSPHLPAHLPKPLSQNKKDQCSGKLSKQLAYLVSTSNIITWNISTPLPVDSPAWAYLSSLSVDTAPVNWTIPWDPIGWHLNLHLLVVANDFICSWSYFRVHFALLPFCSWKLEPIPGFTGREVGYTIDGLTLFSFSSFLNRQLKCHLCLLCLAELKITFQLAA